MYRYVSVDKTEGSTRDISCNTGYMANSNNTNITCLATSEWSAMGVECIGMFYRRNVVVLLNQMLISANGGPIPGRQLAENCFLDCWLHFIK